MYCGVGVHVEDGRVTRIVPDPKDMIGRGYICPRAINGPKWLYHKDQLLYPLKRAGKRGEGKWQRITWEQGLDEVAGKLATIREKHGAEALAFSEGSYRNEVRWCRPRFANLFGNPHNVADTAAVNILLTKAMGNAMVGGGPMPTAAITKCFVFWGMNMPESWDFVYDKLGPMVETKRGNLLQAMAEPAMKFMLKHPPLAYSVYRKLKKLPKLFAREGGPEPSFMLLPRPPKVIAIDPRRTKVAEHADMWLPIRPGTDTALALGWLNVIIGEDLYDHKFIKEWCHGFDELRAAVQDYMPDKVARITGLPEQQIVDSARLYATSRPAMIMASIGLIQNGWSASSFEHAKNALIAITGNVDKFGGNEPVGFPTPAKTEGTFVRDCELEMSDRLPPEQKVKQLGSDKYRLLTFPGWEMMNELHMKISGMPLPQAFNLRSHPTAIHTAIVTGKPYPVKGLISWASNPVVSHPNPKLVIEALGGDHLDLSVTVDFWMTPTSALADYVFPAATWLERPFCGETIAGVKGLLAGEQAVPPLGERKHDYYFWSGLGRRLGQAAEWPWETYEDVMAYRLSRMGLTHEELVARGGMIPYPRKYKKYRKHGFPTPTGKVELYSTVLEKLGYGPLPCYREPPETPVSAPETAKQYPLTLVGGIRFRPMLETEHRQLGMGLREMHKDPISRIHPKAAAQFGIGDGDWIWIETLRGRIKHRAMLTEDTREDLVTTEMGWWYPARQEALPDLFGALESNANGLVMDDPDKVDPVAGSWANRALLCRIYKVEGAATP